jgi:hypothetical protein
MKYDPSYDFSNNGVDWESYESEARLRTDAIWERTKLKDYFRLFYKLFYWDPKQEKYFISMPNHVMGSNTDGWRLREFDCYTPTGRTMAFQLAPDLEYPARSISLNAADSIRDKNALCYYRFRAFKKCEGNSLISQIWEEPTLKGSKEEGNEVEVEEEVDLGCYEEMLDMIEYCSESHLNWLADLWHHMELNTDVGQLGQDNELNMISDEFDNPDATVLTY